MKYYKAGREYYKVDIDDTFWYRNVNNLWAMHGITFTCFQKILTGFEVKFVEITEEQMFLEMI